MVGSFVLPPQCTISPSPRRSPAVLPQYEWGWRSPTPEGRPHPIAWSTWPGGVEGAWGRLSHVATYLQRRGRVVDSLKFGATKSHFPSRLAPRRFATNQKQARIQHSGYSLQLSLCLRKLSRPVFHQTYLRQRRERPLLVMVIITASTIQVMSCSVVP